MLHRALAASRPVRPFLVVLLLGILVRSMYASVLVAAVDVNSREEFYDDIARNLLAGNGYTHDPAAGPNLWRPPLYPVFLTSLFAAFGSSSDLPVIVFQVLFDGLTAAIMYLVGRRLFDERVGILAGVATALYPLSAYYTVRLLSESMFTLILAVIVCVLLRAYASSAPREFALLGVALGAGVLCRPGLELFPVIVVTGALFLARCSPARLLGNVLLMVVVAALVVLPWAVRNYRVTSRFFPLTVGLGNNVWLGNHLPTDGLDDNQLDAEGRRYLAETMAKIIGPGQHAFTAENDKKLLRKAYEEMLDSPGGFARHQIRKFGRFWFSTFDPATKWVNGIVMSMQLPILALAGFGLWAQRRRRGYQGLLPLVIGYFAVISTLVPVTTIRYAMPIMPYVLTLAAYGVRELSLTSARRADDVGGDLGRAGARSSRS